MENSRRGACKSLPTRDVMIAGHDKHRSSLCGDGPLELCKPQGCSFVLIILSRKSHVSCDYDKIRGSVLFLKVLAVLEQATNHKILIESMVGITAWAKVQV